MRLQASILLIIFQTRIGIHVRALNTAKGSSSTTQTASSSSIQISTYEHDGWVLGTRSKKNKSENKSGILSNLFQNTQQKSLPVVLIHPVGIGLSGWFWEKFMTQWQDSDIYCPDLIGCGEIGDEWKPEERGLFFPLDWVRQCETLINEEINGPCVVVTQGGLAPVGVMLAHRNPTMVQKLVLCSPPTWNDMAKAIPQSELERNYNFLRSKLGELALGLLESRSAIQFFSDLFLFEKSCDASWLDNCLNGCTAPARQPVCAFNAGLLNHRSFEEELMELPQQTLVLSGSSDKREIDRSLYMSRMQDCKMMSLPGGQNVLPWETTEDLCKVISKFCTVN